MQDSWEEYRSRLSQGLRATGWSEAALAGNPQTLCFRRPGWEIRLTPYHQMDPEALYQALPEAPGQQRLDLYVSPTSVEPECRKAFAQAALRKGRRRASLGLVELDSATVTLGRPRFGWGAFYPAPLELLLESAAGDWQEKITRWNEFARWIGAVRPLWTWALAGLCLLLFVLLEFSGGSQNLYNLYRWGALWKPAVLQGEFWRLPTATLLHIGWIHFGVNMLSLISVGRPLEALLGRTAFLILFMASGLGGALASTWFHAEAVGAGASGAIFGLAGATVVLARTDRLPIPYAIYRSIASGLMPAILYNLIFGMFVGGIDNAGHLGGLATGSLLIFWLYPRPLQSLQRPQLSRLSWGLPLGFFACLGGSLYLGLTRPLPLSQPYQEYSFGQSRLRIGREFVLAAASGVQRVYKLPGCGLMVAASIPVDKIPSLSEWVEQMKAANLKNLGQPDRVEFLQMGGRQVMLSVFPAQSKRPEVVHLVVLDSAPDLLEIVVMGNSGIQLSLLRALLEGFEGPVNSLREGPSPSQPEPEEPRA